MTSGGIGPAADNSSYNGRGGHAFAGGLFNSGGLALTNVTCHSNAAVGGASLHAGTYLGPRPAGNSYGGTIANTGIVFQIVNSILAGGTSNNAWGTFVDLGHNLSSDATPIWTTGTSLNNSDPMLSPPAANGGPTWTTALRPGSPAISAANCAAAPATDQRGVARLAGSGCDIGAYESTGTFALQIWQESVTTNVIRHAAEVGRTYRLERSTDFSGWIPVLTNTGQAGGWLEFHAPATGSQGFYRVVAQ